MMRSLWSGVSGLNAHQTAMDVEANNIANVNTVGYKYSRTNFQDLLYQTEKSPTAPQGSLGGKNSLQVGLGATVSAVETIFKQGSVKNTDKSTDMAINGDGFFVTSSDGGQTNRYTRAGDFMFDANGNFVDPNGNIVQGWLKNPDTDTIDSTTPIKPINIPPGLTTPAKPTSSIDLKANLNSGNHISEKDPTRSTVDLLTDVNSLYTADGDPISINPDSDKIILKVVNLQNDTVNLTLHYGKSNSDSDGNFQTIKELLDDVNYTITHDTNGHYLDSVDAKRSKYINYLNGDGQIVDPQNRISVDSASTNNTLTNILSKLNGTSTNSDTIKSIKNSFIGADDVGELFNSNGDAINLQDGQGIVANIEHLGENRKFIYTSNSSTGSCGVGSGTFQKDSNITKTDSLEGLHWTYDSGNNSAYMNIKDQIEFTIDGSNKTFKYGKDFQTIDDLCCALNTYFDQNNVDDHVELKNGKIVEKNDKISDVKVEDSAGTEYTDTNTPQGRLDKLFKPLGSGTSTNEFRKNDVYYFHNVQDLSNLWQIAIDDAGDPANSTSGISGVSYIKDGKVQIKNTSTASFNTSVKGYPDLKDNQLFTEAMSPMKGLIAANSTISSNTMDAATHTASVEIFDSLGAKHSISIHFRKAHTANNASDLSQWKWYADIPAPSEIVYPSFGDVKFNSDGSMASVNPTQLNIDPKNGAEAPLKVNLDFGKVGKFDGITSFESPSTTSGISQDGYAGGDLQQLVTDQTGTIIGVFNNGISKPLAQVAIAKFTNNMGLVSDGGSSFRASANSGDPIIGQASTGGRGFIQASALEMSNVDLSKALTELIVIQRGFQANSKTITTSDQMLNTLLQLKR